MDLHGCTSDAERVDATRDARIVMSAIARTGQRFGSGHIVDIVAGADTKRIREPGHHTVKTYGAGRNKPKRHWQRLVDEMLGHGLVVRAGDRYPVLHLTPRGLSVLRGEEDL